MIGRGDALLVGIGRSPSVHLRIPAHEYIAGAGKGVGGQRFCLASGKGLLLHLAAGAAVGIKGDFVGCGGIGGNLALIAAVASGVRGAVEAVDGSCSCHLTAIQTGLVMLVFLIPPDLAVCSEIRRDRHIRCGHGKGGFGCPIVCKRHCTARNNPCI